MTWGMSASQMDDAALTAGSLRSIVERHGAVRVAPTARTSGGVECKTCCEPDSGTDYDLRVGLPFPCPTLLDLAEVYRLSTDDPATED